MGDVTAARGLEERGYEISTRAGEEGFVLASSPPLALEMQRHGDRRCHEVFWGRATPCPNCPFFPPPPGDDDRIRSGVVGRAASNDAFALVVGRRTSAHAIRIVQHAVGDEVLGQLLELRLERAASEANLSPREREVLGLLMIGRSLGDIAIALAITVRTAKYHQANVLGKLGAESRLDLLRLLSLHEGSA